MFFIMPLANRPGVTAIIDIFNSQDESISVFVVNCVTKIQTFQ
jgi:hypothetical protein